MRPFAANPLRRPGQGPQRRRPPRSPRARRSRAAKLGVWSLAVACWLLVAGCGLRPAPTLTGNQDAIVGQEVVTAQLAPLHGASALDRDQALRAAQQFVPDREQAKSVEASLVALTMRDQHGAIAWNLQARPVWLVRFDGAAYRVASGPDAGCACSQYGDRPNTAVALDPSSGALVLTYGFASQP